MARIVCGGQTGADRAALDFALERGIECGGWVPKGRTDERGRIPERYTGLIEADAEDPAERTRLNVRDAEGTVIFSHGALRGGSKLTAEVATELGKPWLHVDLTAIGDRPAGEVVRRWVAEHGIRTLNVAGSRESEDPHIYERTRAVLMAAFCCAGDGI